MNSERRGKLKLRALAAKATAWQQNCCEKSSRINSMSKSPRESKTGEVYLVGAGPGDLGLVTLRAKECIQHAEVIVYDHLANPEVLGWAREDAEIIYAGKKPGESRTQQEITSQLIEKAREGKQVVG